MDSSLFRTRVVFREARFSRREKKMSLFTVIAFTLGMFSFRLLLVWLKKSLKKKHEDKNKDMGCLLALCEFLWAMTILVVFSLCFVLVYRAIAEQSPAWWWYYVHKPGIPLIAISALLIARQIVPQRFKDYLFPGLDIFD